MTGISPHVVILIKISFGDSTQRHQYTTYIKQSFIMKNDNITETRKYLIYSLLLLLECSTANAGILSTKNFTKSCFESEKDIIADKKVCIRMDAQNPPQLFGAKGVYLQNIEMSNVQIITIEKQTVSISMYLKVEWTDWRVTMNIPLSQSVYLSQKDQKRLWSPQILIGTNMVSQNKDEEFVLTQGDSPKATKIFILNTVVKCEMEFQNFPFDKHVCTLEVSTLF